MNAGIPIKIVLAMLVVNGTITKDEANNLYLKAKLRLDGYSLEERSLNDLANMLA